MPAKVSKIQPKKKYQKLTQREHVLKRPDMYVGSLHKTQECMWVFNIDENRMEKKNVNIVMGLYKIFDEILVNASDQHVRMQNSTIAKDRVTQIKVNIDVENNEISVYNNGKSVDIYLDEQENIYSPELIFGHCLAGENFDDDEKKVVGGKNGLGSKCLWEDVLIPMWNGEIKKAKDIQIGEKIIGDDGKIRNILNITKGYGKIFEINQGHGETYRVNENHILTLHMPDHKIIFWNSRINGYSVLWWDKESMCIKKKSMIPKKKRESPIKDALDTTEVRKAYEELREFISTIDDDNIFDISIKDYLKLNNTTKKRLAGIRGECVEWKKKDVLLDPYILGLWLGDGCQRGYSFACYEEKDPEILEYWNKWAKNNDALIKKENYCCFRITSDKNFKKKGYAPLKSQLKKYNLVNNKHIPIDYIINDRETRLKVLAGIIDTDGHVSKQGKRIYITQCIYHEQLAKDIIFLSRSLGFQCTYKVIDKEWEHKGEKKYGTYYKINISGNIGNIPTLLPRKKCSSDRVHSARTTGYLKIKDVGDGNFVGFEIDDNQRFVINDFTVTHNCTNILSSEFIIDLVDSVSKKHYKQRFYNNMLERDDPVITKSTEKPYTKVIFKPDLAKFGMDKLDNDILSLLYKRVYDLTATTDKTCSVYLNDKLIECKQFDKYVDMYIGDKKDSPRLYENVNDRWEIVVALSSDEDFEQVSFVNGISTFHGGKHVDMIASHIANKLSKFLANKGRNKVQLKPEHIKRNMFLFVKCLIENPSFNSQSKECLTTPSKDFGSTCKVSDKLIEKLAKTEIVQRSLALSQHKEDIGISKKDIAKKSRTVRVPDLDDANWAGTNRSSECTLILTEGKSAKALAIAGLSVVGRDKFGVFPLRGKLLNVREATTKQLVENQEIQHIKTIMGLQQYEYLAPPGGKKDSAKKTRKIYKNINELRYGRIMLFVDADVDGGHIKGLLMNFLNTFWPELTELPNFVITLATPIVKASKGKIVNQFYTLGDYQNWKKTNVEKGWTIKYYKGLGTSTAQEAKEYFQNFEQNIIKYQCKDDNCHEAIKLGFSKDHITQRKDWLKNYDINDTLDNNQKDVSYSEFIDKELKHFSDYDCHRSIPSMCDGLKPSQRKILYSCFKRNLKKEIKVAQLAGYVSEHSAYHHGEVSLQQAIINIAQNFVGSNNINLLSPNGQFATRSDPKSAASPRYIFTNLTELATIVYNEKDLPLYEPLDDDGQKIEPQWYLPVLPMIMVNGSEGIGTGFSTNIPSFNPLQIMKNIRNLMDNQELEEMKPWYRGFTGQIEKDKDHTFTCKGKYNFLTDTSFEVTELPVGVWTDHFTSKLDDYVIDKSVTDEKKKKKQMITDYHKEKGCTDTKVHITIRLPKTTLDNYKKNIPKFEKDFDLIKNINTTNMHLYNPKGQIQKYNSVEEILQEFYTIRLEYYLKRKLYWLVRLKRELDILAAKVRFIEYVRDQKIDIRKAEEEIIKFLEEHNFPKFSNRNNDLKEEDEVNEDELSYDYLLRMQIRTLTQKRLEELKKEHENKLAEYKDLESKTDKDLWREDLDQFEKVYQKMLDDYLQEQNSSINVSAKTQVTKKKISSKKNTGKVKIL